MTIEPPFICAEAWCSLSLWHAGEHLSFVCEACAADDHQECSEDDCECPCAWLAELAEGWE